jgi:glycosyltransferase involved in cell wall biosynthesis
MRMQFGPAVSLFWNHISSMPSKPDVVHCNDLDTLLVGALAKRKFGCRLIYDAHEYYPYCDPYGRWVDIMFFSLLEWFLLRRVDGAVTVNPPLADLMSKHYHYRPIYSIPNAEPCAEHNAPVHTSAMSKLAAGRLKCLFQGRYTPKRGIEELITGWQHVDGSKAALFLRGPENVYTEEARILANGLGLLGKSVFFLEPVPEPLLVPAAAEADIGIIPYLPEFLIYQFCCPNKLSQYMHAGMMVVTNNLPYVRSVVDAAEAGLSYDSSSPETLGTAVNGVANDSALLARFKANAVRYAQEHFNWQSYAGIFDALYSGRQPQLANDRLVSSHVTRSLDARPSGIDWLSRVTGMRRTKPD